MTWERLNKLDPGLTEIGRLAVCEAKDLKSSAWSIGCETLDRDYADWDAMKKHRGSRGRSPSQRGSRGRSPSQRGSRGRSPFLALLTSAGGEW